MIALHPLPDAAFDCPACGAALTVVGWHMPGMRVLARLTCPACARNYYGDLPTGQGIYHPSLLDLASGVVHAPFPSWFADELHDNFAAPRPGGLPVRVETFRPLHRPALLNCLDTFYGHCLEKLLNAQSAIEGGADLLIVVPAFLRWLVPDGAAEVWTVDVPLRAGAAWDEVFAGKMRDRLAALPTCDLIPAFPEPDPDRYQIERFTRIAPFDLSRWLESSDRPVVSYIWRDDRLWPEHYSKGYKRDLLDSILRVVMRRPTLHEAYRARVMAVAECLRLRYPMLDFAVMGVGEPGGFAGAITDLRTTRIDEVTEREWCARYARSHVVIGIHGSNMLLPSALAGGVVEIMEQGRDGNIGQDILPTPGLTAREAMVRYRFFSTSASPQRVAHAVSSIIDLLPTYLLHYSRDADDLTNLGSTRRTYAAALQRMQRADIPQTDHLLNDNSVIRTKG